MYRLFIFLNLLFVSTLCFPQQNPGINVIGGIPIPESGKQYELQVGAFKVYQNAERAFEKLNNVSLNPVYEKYLDFTRVMIRGISARDIPLYLENIKNAGFSEVLIRIDSNVQITADLPVSTAALPSESLIEIAYRSVKVGETKSLEDLAENKDVVAWSSSTPSAVTVDSSGNITGVNVGNAFIGINATEYISVVVVPLEEFYVVPESQAAFLPPDSKVGESFTSLLTDYRTEPTFRLAYRFNNKDENRGASGRNGGIDILGRGPDYEWLWTTFLQGGWFYDLNGVQRQMVNGYQKDANNGVELTVKPEFIYDNGVPYLQLRHLLHNSGDAPVSEQRFGASADVMIHQNDFASLLHTSYGAYMTDSASNPSLELMFICESGDSITPVDTLWLGTWSEGRHLYHIYDDERSDVHFEDSAIGYSYQNISLDPEETKEFIVRFTLARNED